MVRRPNARETFGADGVSQGTRLYPSTREYVEGMSVGWEWNYDKRQDWEDTWYKDPQTGKCTQAWSGSIEFIGRNVQEKRYERISTVEETP